MKEKDFSTESSYVESHRDELLEKYRNKYIIVHGEEVIGPFDDYEDAFDEGVSKYGPDGIFLIKQIYDDEPINFIVEALL